MVRDPNMARGKISFAHGIQCCPFFYFTRPASPYCEEYVYIDIPDCFKTVYELPLLPNNTASGTLLHR